MDRIAGTLSSSHGVDVTGGMAGKIADLFNIVQARPELTVQLISGTHPGIVEAVLSGSAEGEGTTMHW